MSAERDRVDSFGGLEHGLLDASDWYLWGPYLSERAWGTVREDYSADGEAWNYFPHDHAAVPRLPLERGRPRRVLRHRATAVPRARAVERTRSDPQGTDLRSHRRSGQSRRGRQGVLVVRRRVTEPCLEPVALSLPAGQRSPTRICVDENARRGKLDPEYELLDTGAFDDDRYWVVEVDYTKADPSDVLMTVRVTNAGPEPDTIHVLPTAWFRNTWSWGDGTEAPQTPGGSSDSVVGIDHPLFGELELLVGDGPGGEPPTLLFCDNETNTARLFGDIRRQSIPERRRQRPRRRRCRHRQSCGRRHQGRLLVPGRGRHPARPSNSAYGCGRRVPRSPRRLRSRRASTTWSRSDGAKPTSSMPS